MLVSGIYTARSPAQIAQGSDTKLIKNFANATASKYPVENLKQFLKYILHWYQLNAIAFTRSPTFSLITKNNRF